jgi:hypothetical protein
MKRKTIIFCLVVILLSCRKDPAVVLDSTLTNCPANHTCDYSYFDGADFNGNQVVHGGSRVFRYTSTDSLFCDATTLFNVKVALTNNNFDITSAQIAAGQGVTAFDLICPCCDYAFISKPIGGEIKGKRVSATTWLLNARIIFGTSATNPTDSIKVNQYFTLAKLP